MRQGTTIHVGPADRLRLEAILADRNSSQKHVWRARVVLAAADGLGTAAIVCRVGLSRPFVRTADADAIVEKVRRGYHALAAVAQQAG